MKKKNIIGLIPARGGSKGIKKKNIKIFNSKPLIYYTINEALKSKYIERLIVSTDDREIADISRRYGAEVPFMRPKELAEDHVRDVPVIKHALLWLEGNGYKADYIVFLRPTNIFRTAEQIDKAIKIMLASDFDSVMGLSRTVYSPYWMKKIVGNTVAPFIETGNEETRRQELPKVYQNNGTIEVIRKDTILKQNSRSGARAGYFMMDDIATTDIDTELDFKIAEVLYPWWKKGLI